MMSEANHNEPPLETKQAQARATDPENTIWVSANAGSGKTYVLARRVIRLLLQGTKPSQILCLTFTTAAAAEMSNRVFEILGEWSIMPDDALANEIKSVTGEPAQPNEMQRARLLFALSLETPGGLKIQTIHAFCDALLHQFPLEANVPAHFDQIDTPEQETLLNEARTNVVLKSLGLKESGNKEQIELLANAFATIRDFASDSAIEEAFSFLIGKRDHFTQWVEGDLLAKMDVAWQHFGFDKNITAERFAEQAIGMSNFSDAVLKECEIQAVAQGASSANVQKLATKIQTYFSKQNPIDKLQARFAIFFTANGEGSVAKSFGTKSFVDSMIGMTERFEKEQAEIEAVREQFRALKSLQATQALFLITKSIFAEYANIKQRHGKLDFDDLISKAADLLTRKHISAWVQYKLDRGIDHVLVDEAQDTSPLQWKIINAITGDFFDGEGAAKKDRTLFIVGDEKQSIFSFQGADPIEFGKQYETLKKSVGQIGKSLQDVQLKLSFRSTQEVLSAVDQVFSLPENRRGLSMLDDLPPHTAHRSSHEGEVVLWPIVNKPAKAEQTDWRTPPDKVSTAAVEVLANRIASEIKSWIANKQKLPGRSSPIKEGDILILLRKRDAFATAITKALKAKGLATAGADRLKLTEHIVSEDMMALGRFVTMQHDDLSLAALLKSPLFGFSEDELFELAHARGSVGLYSHLCRFEAKDVTFNEKLNKAKCVLVDLITQAQKVPVFEFYAGLFARYNLRVKYLERLGTEAEEVIDGFLQAAIKHDGNLASGLTNFIEWLSNAAPEIKREIDLKTNEIRVITAHSSKGLEAPIVFLVDPCTKAFRTEHLPKMGVVNHKTQNPFYLWQPNKRARVSACNPFFESCEEAMEHEYRRLLYVGMTRAADRLIICGYGKDDNKFDHWHQMVEKGLSAVSNLEQHSGHLIDEDNGSFPIKRWKIENPARRVVEAKSSDEARTAQLKIPNWLQLPVKPEEAPPRPLTPSGVLKLFDIAPERKYESSALREDSEQALKIGNAVHDLLQILPETHAGEHENVIEHYFNSFADKLSLKNKQRAQRDVIAVLNNPAIKECLSEGSRAEVSISGSVEINNKQYVVHGQIDRLLVGTKKVLLADYKTNFNPPKTAQDIDAEYLAQLALYQLLLQNIYPNHEIEAVLVWVSNASVMQVPDQLLKDQLKRLK